MYRDFPMHKYRHPGDHFVSDSALEKFIVRVVMKWSLGKQERRRQTMLYSSLPIVPEQGDRNVQNKKTLVLESLSRNLGLLSEGI